MEACPQLPRCGPLTNRIASGSKQGDGLGHARKKTRISLEDIAINVWRTKDDLAQLASFTIGDLLLQGPQRNE
jgi:hypothetical protein